MYLRCWPYLLWEIDYPLENRNKSQSPIIAYTMSVTAYTTKNRATTMSWSRQRRRKFVHYTKNVRLLNTSAYGHCYNESHMNSTCTDQIARSSMFRAYWHKGTSDFPHRPSARNSRALVAQRIILRGAWVYYYDLTWQYAWDALHIRSGKRERAMITHPPCSGESTAKTVAAVTDCKCCSLVDGTYLLHSSGREQQKHCECNINSQCSSMNEL